MLEFRVPWGLKGGVIVGGSLGVLNVALYWGSVFGPRWWGIPGVEFVTSPALLLALVVLPTSALLIVVPQLRDIALNTLLASALVFGLILLSLSIGYRVRSYGFAKLAKRLDPVVEGLRDYERENGAPPPSLDVLVPELRQDLPPLELLTGDEVPQNYHGNSWVIYLDAPTGLINWDAFLYYPLENYPGRGEGDDYFEVIGRWAYLHE